jgi:hypothetical protein
MMTAVPIAALATPSLGLDGAVLGTICGFAVLAVAAVWLVFGRPRSAHAPAS